MKEQPIKGWVKASERKPTDRDYYFIKVNGAMGIAYYHEVYDKFIENPGEEYKCDNLEWLNDTPIAEGEERWISVEDRLPEVSEGEATEVIINSHVEQAPEKDVSLCGVFYEGNFYVCAEWEGGDPDAINPIEKGRVTHWQPIPKFTNQSNAGEERLFTLKEGFDIFDKGYLRGVEEAYSKISGSDVTTKNKQQYFDELLSSEQKVNK